jgi:hypothetical protein
MAGDRSLEAWIEILLEDQRDMDSKTNSKEFEGTKMLCGKRPQTNRERQLCTPCWERREAIRRCRRSGISYRLHSTFL